MSRASMNSVHKNENINNTNEKVVNNSTQSFQTDNSQIKSSTSEKKNVNTKKNLFEKLKSTMDIAFSFLLCCMFVAMILVCIIIIVAAFNNLCTTNHTIAQILDGLKNTLPPEFKNSNNGDISQLAKYAIERLTFASKGALDSNTISFLFQVFTIALVSTGGFILYSSQQNLKDAHEKTKEMEEKVTIAEHTASVMIAKAKKIDEYKKEISNIEKRIKHSENTFSDLSENFKNYYLISEIFNNLLLAHGASSHIKRTSIEFSNSTSSSEEFTKVLATYIPLLRDNVKTIKQNFFKLKATYTEITLSQTNIFCDMLTYILSDISNLHTGFAQPNIVKDCNTCLKLVWEIPRLNDKESLNILILDDSDRNKLFVKELTQISDYKYTTYTATNIEEANALLEIIKTNCIIADLYVSRQGLQPHEMDQISDKLLPGWIWLKNYVFDKPNLMGRIIIYSDYINMLKRSVSDEELERIHLVAKSNEDGVNKILELIDEIQNKSV